MPCGVPQADRHKLVVKEEATQNCGAAMLTVRRADEAREPKEPPGQPIGVAEQRNAADAASS